MVWLYAIRLREARYLPDSSRHRQAISHVSVTLANHPWDEPLKRITVASAGKKYRLLTPMIVEPVRLNDESTELLRASKEGVSQIDTLAAGMDRSRNYVVNQAIQQYLAYHHVLNQKIDQGLKDAKEGRLTGADCVMKEIRSHRARRRK